MSIVSKPATKNWRKNYDRVFKKGLRDLAAREHTQSNRLPVDAKPATPKNERA